MSALRYSWSGTHMLLCVYDPASAALVGAEATDDANDLCGGLSNEIFAGNVPDACSGPVLQLRPTVDAGCPSSDAGDAQVRPDFCATTLADARNGCASSYGAALTASCGMPASQTTYAGECGGRRAVGYASSPNAPEGWALCVYSADGSALVGAASATDFDEYCNGTAYVLYGGDVPDACLANPSYLGASLPMVTGLCVVDGGATSLDASSD
jgi:hypothetical protein